jgi:Xaa-Pro dipeptidase
MSIDPDRISRNKNALRENSLDAFICRLPENVVFLSGWWPLTGTSWIIFTADGYSHLIVPACEAQEATAEGITELTTYEWAHLAAKDPVGETKIALKVAAEKFGIEKGQIGIEEIFEGVAPPLNIGEPSIPGKWSKQLIQQILPQAKISDATEVINGLRVLKTPTEIEKLRIANEIASVGLDTFKKNAMQGISEIELLALINSAIAVKGSGYKGIKSARGFAQISSGKGTAMAWRPCVITTNRKLQNGDITILELAVVADGFWADNTRSVVVGGPDKWQKKIYEVILKAQSAAKDAIKPGVKMSIVDKAARDIINKNGYGKYFIHITGHGVGWRYHEFPPLLNPGNVTPMQEGMVTSVEPGIYIPDFGGFRVEDNVAVSKSGFDELSTFNRDLA